MPLEVHTSDKGTEAHEAAGTAAGELLANGHTKDGPADLVQWRQSLGTLDHGSSLRAGPYLEFIGARTTRGRCSVSNWRLDREW